MLLERDFDYCRARCADGEVSVMVIEHVPHLVDCRDGWTMWRWVFVRGAGFPARGPLELADPDVVAVADRLLQLEAEGVASEQVAQQRGELERAYRAGLVRTADALLRIAADARFREALLWQNPRALHTGVDWLLAHPEADHANARRKQHLIASYLQRYCVKNDTIGFFGPNGFGELTGARQLVVRPGPALIAKRTVHFEHWTIDTLARVLADDRALKPYMRPRRTPTVRIDGRTVHYPVARRSELPLEYARLLAACDGVATAREIAAGLLANRELELADEAEVFALLDDLVAKRFCTWMFEVPTVTEWPERHLRAQLATFDDEPIARALGILDALEAKRDAVAAAAGDPERLDPALAALAQTFEGLTAKSATRRGGQMYAGRTPVYEECRRDLVLELGTDFLDRIGPPLLPILQSARWYTFRIAELYRAALVTTFHEAAGGAASVDYLAFWHQAKRLFPEDGSSPLVAQAIAELQRGWCEIAGFDPAARRLELASATIGPRIADVFAAPHPGWPGARYHSPDVMIAAPSADAIRAGRGIFVLGEFHPSTCTIHFAAQKVHPERAALIRARELDLPETIPTPVIAKEHASRADHMWLSGHDLDVELGTTRSWRSREHVVAVGDLVLEHSDGQLRVRDRGGRWSFEVVEFFATYLTAAINTQFAMFPIAAHVPRISIDGVVVVREQWHPVPATLEFAALHRGPPQFVAARRWAHHHGLPRWVFVKIPEEPKPVYVDFDSPIYVEILAKLVRKASRLTFSEMLPTPLETWLPDIDGRTYTCELRMVAVDPARSTPST